MFKRSVRSVSVLLMSCFAASLFTGCDLPWGKKDAQAKVAEAYVAACFEFDYHGAAALVVDKDDAFQDVILESPQREICELVLSGAQFEVLKVDNDRALVSVTMPDIDRALRRENTAALELEDLEDILGDTDKMLEEEFEFDFIKEDKEWLIDPDSTEDFAEFISEIGLQVAPQIGLGSRAEDYFNALMTYLEQGNIAAAYDILYSSYGGISGSGYYGSDIDDIVSALYSSIFGHIDYETEVVSCNDSSVTLEVTGTRVDFASTIADVSANNADVSVPYLKRMMLFYVESFREDSPLNSNANSYQSLFFSEDFLHDYLQNISEFYIGCIEVGYTESFTVEITVDVGEDGSFSFDGDPINAVMGDMSNPEYSFADEFHQQAVDELLASGEITEEEYEELSELNLDELVTFF